MDTHLLGTHLATEPFVIASHRELSVSHPLFKLLHPHFKFELAINTLGRERFLSSQGILMDVFALDFPSLQTTLTRAWASYDFSKQAFPAWLAARNLSAESNDIPEFHYIHDANYLWNSLLLFVQDILSPYYPDDAHIHQDTELQSWARFIHNSFGPQRGFPASVQSLPQLIQIATTFIFSVTVQHAAFNYPHFDTCKNLLSFLLLFLSSFLFLLFLLLCFCSFNKKEEI
jgi:hypothetical protein